MHGRAAAAPPSPLIAVPNVTAHPSTTSVYSSPYCCVVVRYSAIFAARCYASAAYVVMRCACVSGCVSVTFVHSVKMNKHIFEFFSPSVVKSL